MRAFFFPLKFTCAQKSAKVIHSRLVFRERERRGVMAETMQGAGLACHALNHHTWQEMNAWQLLRRLGGNRTQAREKMARTPCMSCHLQTSFEGSKQPLTDSFRAGDSHFSFLALCFIFQFVSGVEQVAYPLPSGVTTGAPRQNPAPI